MSWVIVTITVIPVALFLLFRTYQKRNRELLARHGVVARGRVVKKHRRPLHEESGDESGCIVYDFYTPSGKRIENSVLVGEVIYEVYEKGSEIEVVYLKKNPEVSGAKYKVDLSRAVMGMPPL